MDEQNKGKPFTNKWKKFFYILLTLNVLIAGILMALIFWPVSKTDLPNTETLSSKESSSFTIRTTKKNLNELVNAYLGKLDSKYHYQIKLGDDVHLIGELPVFSTAVPLSVHLEPIVQDNGNVILKQKSISIGLLELPNKKIMEYMKMFLPMPDWVTVNPKQEEIYVAVDKMDIKSNFQISIEHLDLGANDLAFKIKVPYKTLGIELAKLYQ